MSKYMRTTRICLSDSKLLYCTSQIATECRPHLIRLNQIFHPLKGHADELGNQLAELARQRPDEFSNASLAMLGLRFRDSYDRGRTFY